MNDPISDMLTRIRNASRALLPNVEVPHSRLKESLAGILRKEGYIAEYTVEGKLPKKIKLRLKYQGKKSIISTLTANSSPICADPWEIAAGGNDRRYGLYWPSLKHQ